MAAERLGVGLAGGFAQGHLEKQFFVVVFYHPIKYILNIGILHCLANLEYLN